MDEAVLNTFLQIEQVLSSSVSGAFLFFPSPLFPHKPSLAHSNSLTSFTNNIAAAASSPRFNPYSYNRYTSSFLGSHYSSALFSPFPQSPLQFHFPLTGISQELERSHSPSVPDSPSPIVLERNEFCRK